VEMKVGPSTSACRCRCQTATSCFGECAMVVSVVEKPS
jgi:hypothetical protein